MSRARAKGNALEIKVAGVLQNIDGMDPLYERLQSKTGRLGHLYDLQVDVVTRNFAVECKNRENLAASTWDWLDGLESWRKELKLPLLVTKRNARRPLVTMYLEDFEEILAAAKRSGWGQ